MVIMILEKPNAFQPGSLEDMMSEPPERLPDDYMVFHSLRITKVKYGKVH